MSLRLWIIIGEANTGKSTVVGHLTGQFGASASGVTPNRGPEFSDVLMPHGGMMSLFSMRCALQENPHGEGGVQAELDHLEKKWSRRCSPNHPNNMNCLITLRHHPENGCPDAFTYLSSFVAEDCTIQKLVVFGQEDQKENYLKYGAETLFYQAVHGSVSSVEIGHRVAFVRRHFGWA